MKRAILIICVAIALGLIIWLTGCAVQQKPTTKETILDSDLSEKGKTWLMVLSETDKQFGFLILIGVIGGATAFYFKDPKLLGIPLCAALGCFFLKVLITAGDILAYICVVAVILILVFYIARYWRALMQVVKGGELFQKTSTPDLDAVGGFKNSQRQIQTPATTKLVKTIKDNLEKENSK